jgi:hypothetical protein
MAASTTSFTKLSGPDAKGVSNVIHRHVETSPAKMNDGATRINLKLSHKINLENITEEDLRVLERIHGKGLAEMGHSLVVNLVTEDNVAYVELRVKLFIRPKKPVVADAPVAMVSVAVDGGGAAVSKPLAPLKPCAFWAQSPGTNSVDGGCQNTAAGCLAKGRCHTLAKALAVAQAKALLAANPDA